MVAGKVWAAGIADSENFDAKECKAKVEKAYA